MCSSSLCRKKTGSTRQVKSLLLWGELWAIMRKNSVCIKQNTEFFAFGAVHPMYIPWVHNIILLYTMGPDAIRLASAAWYCAPALGFAGAARHHREYRHRRLVFCGDNGNTITGWQLGISGVQIAGAENVVVRDNVLHATKPDRRGFNLDTYVRGRPQWGAAVRIANSTSVVVANNSICGPFSGKLRTAIANMADTKDVEASADNAVADCVVIRANPTAGVEILS